MSRGVAERFGANLARLREQAEVTQEELAFRASLHPPDWPAAVKVAGENVRRMGARIEAQAEAEAAGSPTS